MDRLQQEKTTSTDRWRTVCTNRTAQRVPLYPSVLPCLIASVALIIAGCDSKTTSEVTNGPTPPPTVTFDYSFGG
jgi:hypothetical protein